MTPIGLRCLSHLRQLLESRQMNGRLHLFGLALTILLILTVACGEDSARESVDPSATLATATVAVSATSTPSTTEGATGIPELDAVVDALRSGDAETLRPLIEFRPVALQPGGPDLHICARVQAGRRRRRTRRRV